MTSLGQTLSQSRLLVMCGSGGVGKTTTSAALALHIYLPVYDEARRESVQSNVPVPGSFRASPTR